MLRGPRLQLADQLRRLPAEHHAEEDCRHQEHQEGGEGEQQRGQARASAEGRPQPLVQREHHEGKERRPEQRAEERLHDPQDRDAQHDGGHRREYTGVEGRPCRWHSEHCSTAHEPSLPPGPVWPLCPCATMCYMKASTLRTQAAGPAGRVGVRELRQNLSVYLDSVMACLLYTSDAADELLLEDLDGR